MQAKPPHPRRVFSSSPGGSLPRGPHQIRTWRFPPSGSSADVARGSRATTVRSCGDMIRRRRSAGHGSLRTITPTRAAFARPGPGGYPFPGVIARMQPSDSLIPIGLGSGRPLPSAYPGARATRSNEGLPGVRAVLFQRAVVVDPAGCGALLAHGAGPAVAFRLHEALGTQEDVVSRLQGLRPTPSRTYASATALPRSPQGSLPAWVGWPLTGRGSHPLDDTQGFMTYSSIPLDRPAWPHHATTPRAVLIEDQALHAKTDAWYVFGPAVGKRTIQDSVLISSRKRRTIMSVVSKGGIHGEVFRDVAQDALARSGILNVRIAVCPISARMQRVPWRAQIRTRLRIVTVLSKAVADADFIVPNRLEEMNEVVLGGFLPSRLDN